MGGAQQATSPTILPYQDAPVPAEQRITDLLQRMTVDERIVSLRQGCVVQDSGLIPEDFAATTSDGFAN
jgi:hypothetical protein